MRFTKLLAAATVSVVAATSAHAASMAEFDTDGNGSINFEEYDAAFGPDMTEEQFRIIDTNGDGMIDETEYAEATAHSGLLAGK